MNVTPLVATREAGTSQSGRRRFFRLPSASHVLIALAVVLAFSFNFLALQDRSETSLVAVARNPLQAGSTVGPDDVRFVSIDADFEGLAGLIGESDWPGLEGAVLQRSIDAGGVIDISSLAAPAASNGLRSMSLPVAIEHAAGGSLVSGDVVDVISTSPGGAEYIAVGLPVIGVADRDSGSLGASVGYHLILAVTADQALALASAIDGGSVEVVRATGAASVEVGGDG